MDRLDFSESLSTFLDSVFAFVNGVLNTVFTELAALFSTLSSSFF